MRILVIAMVLFGWSRLAGADWELTNIFPYQVQAGTCTAAIWRRMDAAGTVETFTSTSLRLGHGMRLAIAVQADADRGKALPVSGMMQAAGGIAAINGGYYTQDFLPDGLLRKDGITVSATSAATVMSGFLAIARDGAVTLRRRADGPGDDPWVRQCGPFLIDPGGTVGIKMIPDAPAARRSLVAVSAKGEVTLVATSDVSLADLARCLHVHPAGFGVDGVERALNLDGGPSTALVVNGPDPTTEFSERKAVRDCLVVLAPK